MKNKDVYIHIRIPQDLKDKIIKRAKQNYLSMNAYIITLLLDIFDIEGEY